MQTNDVYIINDESKRIKCLKKFSLKDIWGIGEKLAFWETPRKAVLNCISEREDGNKKIRQEIGRAHV